MQGSVSILIGPSTDRESSCQLRTAQSVAGILIIVLAYDTILEAQFGVIKGLLVGAYIALCGGVGLQG